MAPKPVDGLAPVVCIVKPAGTEVNVPANVVAFSDAFCGVEMDLQNGAEE